MESFKIQIEVNLGEATLEILKALVDASGRPTNEATKTEAAEPQPKKTTKKKAVEAASAPAPEPEPAPAPAPEPEPAPAEAPTCLADDEDMPPDDAPAPVKTPTMEEVRKTIREVREQNVTAGDIQKMLKDKFGVATSAECPAEKRTELIKELKKLVA